MSRRRLAAQTSSTRAARDANGSARIWIVSGLPSAVTSVADLPGTGSSASTAVEVFLGHCSRVARENQLLARLRRRLLKTRRVRRDFPNFLVCEDVRQV